MLIAVETVLAKFCAIRKPWPFAFHLTHLYNKSLIEPVGFDNILFIAAHRRQPALVRLFPVLYKHSCMMAGGAGNLYDYLIVYSSVYPFTDSHMDYVLGI